LAPWREEKFGDAIHETGGLAYEQIPSQCERPIPVNSLDLAYFLCLASYPLFLPSSFLRKIAVDH
jgi:hypothetical protein